MGVNIQHIINNLQAHQDHVVTLGFSGGKDSLVVVVGNKSWLMMPWPLCWLQLANKETR